MTWRWSITASSREIADPEKLRGRRLVLRRHLHGLHHRPDQPLSKPHLRSWQRPILSSYGHDQYQKDYETELGHPWENKAAWKRSRRSYRVTKSPRPRFSWAAKSIGTFPFSAANRCSRLIKRLPPPPNSSCIPANTTNSKRPLTSRTASSGYLAWYAHYVKGESTPARSRTCRTRNQEKGE